MAENEVKSDVAKREEEILAFWQKEHIFEESLKKDAPKGDYIFYDGPPFATGLPHYGHIVASVIKDVVPRYYTMQGYHVPRRWGWDCHGLPIENIVEKELGFKHKKEIIALGVDKFNELCRSKVMTYADEWKKIIPRIGRWADMDNPYFTMDRDFMESVWWVFRQLYDKGLVYEDYRSMYICPRCETTLSQSEVAEWYKDVKDLSVTAKFKVKNPEKIDLSGDVYILAWTTTPWTLPGNVALAVGKDIEYLALKARQDTPAVFLKKGDVVIFAKGAEGKLFKKAVEENHNVEFEPISWNKENLVGLEYEPLFDSYSSDTKLKNKENGWKVYAADFVTTEDGTGIVHIAPAFGADDMALGKRENLPFVQHVGMDGIIKPDVKEFAGLSVKPIDDVQSTDVEVIKYLAGKGLLFAKEKYEHSYPHCWRCDTPLINYATSSWFVKIEEQKEKLLKNAKPINWSPEHIKEGRWGKWLEGARDWSISRQRFWASVIPIWRCEQCKAIKVFGSASELEQESGKKVDDLHKHIVDEITVPCACGDTMKRIPDVIDTWFDSGSMPYGQMHFMGETQTPPNFPAQFIAEGQDQCRAWFYYMHVLSASIFDTNAFQNVIVNGIVLAEDGKKMSKKLKNYPDPMLIVDKYGADALRLYLLASPVMQAENLNFSEKGVAEWRGVLTRLENVLSFYQLYEKDIAHAADDASAHVLDRWILARLAQLTNEMTDAMAVYNLTAATRPIMGFVDDLSTWYLRRSRDRIKGDDMTDKKAALETTRFVLCEMAKVIAPFAPFVADRLWLAVGEDVKSVHLSEWPKAGWVDSGLLLAMGYARSIASMALQQRDAKNIKVRQPLSLLKVRVYLPGSTTDAKLLEQLIKDEVNVKEIQYDSDILFDVQLDTTITPELREEGIKRDTIRLVQDARKAAKLSPGEHGAVTITVTENRDVVEKFLTEIGALTKTDIALG